MRRQTHWVTALVGAAAVLGILTVSAQTRQDRRVPPRLRSEPRSAGEGLPPRDTPRAARSLTPPVQRAPQIPSEQPEPSGPIRVAALSARDVRDWNAWATRMARSGDLRLRRIQEDTILRGRQHERYDQFYRGVPVFGGDIVRETYGNVALSMFGTVYAGIDLVVTPALSAEDAVTIFERETGQGAGPLLRAVLIVLPKDDGRFVLTYRLSQFTGHELPVLFVNATTGAVELRYNNLQSQQAAIGLGSGVFGDEKKFSGTMQGGIYYASDYMRPPVLMTFDLHGNLSRTESIIYGGYQPFLSDLASDPDNYWTDGAAVDAHCYLGWTYDYYYKRFARRGIDGNDAPIRAIVHPVSRAIVPWLGSDDLSTYAMNAFWCGADCSPDRRGYLVFGEGIPSGYWDAKGRYWDYLSGAIDAVAHELTHALTEFSSNLSYRQESGALNEAFSDILATGVEFYFQPPGDGLQRADYLAAEDVVRSYLPGSMRGLRSLADPLAYGDPDNYRIRKVGPTDKAHDYGYVHTNSLIAGHAFYLAIEGGTNRTSGLSVQGVGGANREQIEKVFYRAFVYYLPSNATFSTARAATVRSAQELYGVGSAADQAVTQAWTAVGVF